MSMQHPRAPSTKSLNQIQTPTARTTRLDPRPTLDTRLDSASSRRIHCPITLPTFVTNVLQPRTRTTCHISTRTSHSTQPATAQIPSRTSIHLSLLSSPSPPPTLSPNSLSPPASSHPGRAATRPLSSPRASAASKPVSWAPAPPPAPLSVRAQLALHARSIARFSPHRPLHHARPPISPQPELGSQNPARNASAL